MEFLIPALHNISIYKHEQSPTDELVTAFQNEHMDSATDKVISDTYIRIQDKYTSLNARVVRMEPWQSG